MSMRKSPVVHRLNTAKVVLSDPEADAADAFPALASALSLIARPARFRPTPQPPSTLDAQLSSDSATFAALARLSPARYDRVRKAEAKRLEIRIETLDQEVAKARAEADYDDQARAIKLPPVEPWPEPVNGAE